MVDLDMVVPWALPDIMQGIVRACPLTIAAEGTLSALKINLRIGVFAGPYNALGAGLDTLSTGGALFEEKIAFRRPGWQYAVCNAAPVSA